LIETPTTTQARKPAARTPLRVWVGLAIAVALDVPVQLLWKALMIKYRDPIRGPHGHADHSIGWFLAHHHWGMLAVFVWGQIRFFLRQLRTWGLLSLFACQFFDWIWVLGNADLSFAQPFTALSYVAVSTCAVLFFKETISPLRLLGITAILAGVILVGSSEHKTTDIELPIVKERP
jgi:drug/metabolite transporter (DMT)-like permease